MKLVIAATGASGAIYLQRLLSQLDPVAHEIHLVLSNYARQVIHEELGEHKWYRAMTNGNGSIRFG